MKRVWFLLACLFYAVGAISQTAAFNGFCEQGGVSASVSGLPSSNKLNGVIPACTVTVFLTGTTTKATLTKDAIGTPLSNPFTAAVLGSVAPGQWLFYAAIGQGYDVVMSGGIAPLVYTQPVTLTDLIVPSGGGGGGGVTDFSAGSLLPIFSTTVTNPTTNPLLTFNLINAQSLGFLGNVANSTGAPSYVTLIPGQNIAFAENTASSPKTLTISSSGGTQLPPPIPIPNGQAVAWAYPTACTAGPSSPSTNGNAICGPQSGFVAKYFSSPLGNCCWTDTWFGFVMPTLPSDAVIQNIYGVEVVQHTTSPPTATGITNISCNGNGMNQPDAGINYLGEYFTTSLGSTSSVVTSATCSLQIDSSLGPESLFNVNAISDVAIAIYYTTATPPPPLPLVPITTGITFQANGTTSATQNLLNIAAASPIVVSDNGLGTYTISCPSCGSSSGGSNVSVNGGGALANVNLSNTTPAPGTNGINVLWQNSGSNVSAEIVGDGNSAHFLNGIGTYTTPPGAAPSFSTITSGTNTTMAAIVGAGASLTFASTGTINASSISGVALSGLCQTGGTGCPSAGTGTVTDGSGTSTAGLIAESTTTLHGIDYNSLLDNGHTTANTLTYSGTGGIEASNGPLISIPTAGHGGSADLGEGTNPFTPTAGHDYLYADSTSHCIEYSANGGSFACLGSGGGGSGFPITLGSTSIASSSTTTTLTGFASIGSAVFAGTGSTQTVVNLSQGTAASAPPVNTIQFGAPTSVTSSYTAFLPTLAPTDAGGDVWVVPSGGGTGMWQAYGSATCGSGNIPCTNTTNTFTAEQTLNVSSTTGATLKLKTTSTSSVVGIDLLSQGGKEWQLVGGGTLFAANCMYINDATDSNSIAHAWCNNGTPLEQVRSDSIVGWSHTTNATDSMDTAFSRASAGLLALGNGTAGNTSASLSLLSINPHVYTVSTLPSASSFGAGTMVMVSDASTFTPGTCTGGGSDYMIAVTNGTAWSCH